MENVYQGLFWFGVLYAVAGFFLGHLGHIGGMDSLDHGGEFSVGGHGAEGLHAEVSGPGEGHGGAEGASHPSPLKPLIIASFFIVFGATGLTGEHLRWTFGQVLALALVLGSLVSAALFRFVVAPLYRLQNTSAATRDQLIGLDALVTTPIYKDGFGTISYRINDNIYNAPAKSLTGKFIAQGERTVIIKFEGKAFIVHIAEEFSNKI